MNAGQNLVCSKDNDRKEEPPFYLLYYTVLCLLFPLYLSDSSVALTAFPHPLDTMPMEPMQAQKCNSILVRRPGRMPLLFSTQLF